MSEQMGEVEIKVNGLVEEVFNKYNKNSAPINSEEGPLLTKENVRDFLRVIMEVAGEDDAWDEDEFETCYREFDYDGSGTVNKSEFTNLIKRFAAL